MSLASEPATGGEASPDLRLVERIRAGERGAEAELVERYNRGLMLLLRRLTGDPALSEDLCHETLRIVLEKLRAGELREPERLAGFVRGTAKYLHANEVRKVGRRRRAGESPVPTEPEEVPEVADAGPGPLDRLLQAEDQQRVRRLLGELGSERDRQVLLQVYLAETSREEVCSAMGLSPLQLNVILFRARQRFRELVESAERRAWGVLRA